MELELLSRPRAVGRKVDRTPWEKANERLRKLAISAGVWGLLKTGKIDDKQRRMLLLRQVDEAKIVATLLGQDLVSGKLATADWSIRFLDWLLPAHRASVLALDGKPTGRSQEPLAVPFVAEKETERQSDRQLAYFGRFRAGIESGAVPLDGRVPVRSALYARALWGLAVNVVRQETIGQATQFQVWERRVLGLADHCPDCPPLAGRGWVPIGTLPRIGNSVCGPFCACHFEYQRRPPPRGFGTVQRTTEQPKPPTPQPQARPPVTSAANVPRFGPSRANVVIRGDATEQASIRRVADRIFARPTTDQNLASLAGAPDSVTVRIVRVGQSEKLNAYMETPHWYSGSTFRKSATGPVIELDTIEVMQGQQGKGIARKIVGRMIESASEHGVSRITMEAASGAENVGYKVWPRMGFDGPIPASQKTVLPASLHGSERVSDLYATSAGREWWAAHGGDVHLEFDLSPGSKSWRTWISYLTSKK